ncbi:peptidylprolyl isomerase [Winogradskyella sp. A3E31]|uniref:peptidylprolyl isomerase n=1 Tax=Winogradskyella sp. A3E31 TaxID=3349637 RepID=UPI00398AD84F
MKSTTNKITYIFFALVCFSGFSQEIIKDEEVAKVDETIKTGNRIKADGVAAVVGDFIVLDSDLDRRIDQITAQGGNLDGVSRCELFGSILEEKLYAHQAIQDSIIVNELQIRNQIEQQIEAFLAQSNGGSMNDLLELYKKESEEELREEMFEINKNGSLARQMQQKIIADLEITPEEVREFYNELKEDGLPTFGTELQVSQIVIIPEVTEEAKQKAIDQLKGFKDDIENNGASFTSKVLVYSDDSGSKRTGGKMILNRKQPRMVKEFRDVAFSLQEGEISEPFETDFGYHIILLEKIRGQEYEVRHILIRPDITQEAIQAAKDEIDKVRESIVNGDIEFAAAAREFSDEKETKFEGGKLTNPITQDFNFELTKMEPEVYAQIQNLKDGEISEVLQDEDRINRIKFKIITVSDRIDEHEANFSRDYLKIKNLALQDKQFQEVAKWQKTTIEDTYIKINGEYRDCDFTSNWLKK